MKRQQRCKLKRLLTQEGAAKFFKVGLSTLGLVLAMGRVMKAQSSTPEVAAEVQQDSVQGLWQLHNPRAPRQVLLNIEVVSSGDRLTLRALPDGKPDRVIFEGGIESDSVATGQAVDSTSPPDNPRWFPSKVVLRDVDHLEMDGGAVLTRAKAAYAVRFARMRKLAQTPLPPAPFDIAGEWRFDDGFRVILRQDADGITLSTADGTQRAFFRGRYTSNPRIEGENWAPGSTAQNPQWVARTLTVMGPDRILEEGQTLTRTSPPRSHDLACDAANRNHVIDYHAWQRGVQAAAEKNFAVARCWLEIGAEWDFAPAESLLAGLVLKGSGGMPPDPARAFKLARTSAEHGDASGQYALAAMYERGEGTASDPEQAKLWRTKGDWGRSAELWKGMQSGMIGGHSFADILSMNRWIFRMVDFDLDMTPKNNCFDRDVLGTRRTTACPN